MSIPFRRTSLAAAILSSFAVSALADTQLPTVLVQASGISYVDSDATYASEIHDRARIEASGATSLVEYLSQNTTLNVAPSYGNSLAPILDMRGYGLANGFENIAISVDGRRLNEIDMVPAWLGTIPLDAIERIEITKGSGSVAFGDGATAGSIQIYTRTPSGANVSAIVGNHGYSSLDLSGGAHNDLLEISVSAHNEDNKGASQADITGHRAAAENRTERATLAFTPVKGVKLTLDGSQSHIDTRFPSPLTLAQFNRDPSQNGGGSYTQQIYDAGQWRLSGEFLLGDGWRATISHNQEQKQSNYVTYSNISNYDYGTDEIQLNRKGEYFDVSTGWRDFDGTRKATGNDTSKRSQGLFAQAAWRIGAATFSAGLRQDHVSYVYAPKGGNRLSSGKNLNAWDVGVNYRLDEHNSLFANINSAFLAPDIDTFFTYSGAFNAFIVPEHSRTLNIGYNRDDANNRLRATVFYSHLEDEIYYNSITWTNTNLDRTHKYGLELQDLWRLNDQLSLSAMYTYTQALIDKTAQGNGSYDGKEMPGVSHHGVTLGLAYEWSPGYTLNLNQVWRSKSYVMEDFSNSATQRQAAYQVTNLSLRYRQKDWESFLTIANLLDHKNGLWVRSDAIYPVDFSRTVRVGLKKSFQ